MNVILLLIFIRKVLLFIFVLNRVESMFEGTQ